jgi:hypothetical protein
LEWSGSDPMMSAEKYADNDTSVAEKAVELKSEVKASKA